MRILNAWSFSKPGLPATARATLAAITWPGLAANTSIDTVAGWQSLQDSGFSAGNRIGDQSEPGAIVAAGDGRMISGNLGGGVLISAKRTILPPAFFGNGAVELDCILAPGVPGDDYDRSIWVWMLGKSSPAFPTGSANNTGVLAALQTTKVQLYAAGPPAGQIIANAAGAFAAGPHTIRLELAANGKFNVYVDGALYLANQAGPFASAVPNQQQSDGSFGFGFASSTGVVYPSAGVTGIRLTTL